MQKNLSKKTAIFEIHLHHGARMVPFAGYSMPVSYKDGIIAEHLHTRAKAGLFDVSHMGQIKISGLNLNNEIEKLIPIDLGSMRLNTMRYSFLMNENGGIIDDLIISKVDNGYFLVANASRKKCVIDYFLNNVPKSINIELLNNRSLFSLQGPVAKNIVSTFIPNLEKLFFLNCISTTIKNINCFVSRSGYSGEDGFEISVDNKDALDLAGILLNTSEVRLVGLGARDSLRLEAGLCLYGHEINENTTPFEANLMWAIPKKRMKEGGFIGYKKLLEQSQQVVNKTRIGLVMSDKMVARKNNEILNDQGKRIGAITSGTFSPSLNVPIGMGYINNLEKLQNHPTVLIRKKKCQAKLSRLPFVQTRYYKYIS